MKVLWVTNVPIGKHKELLGISAAQSGGWMETTYSELRLAREIELGVCTLYSGSEIKKAADGRNLFYLVPSGRTASMYEPNQSNNIKTWHKIIDAFQPDLIQLWGTEYSMGVDIMQCCGTIPVVVYIQGVMSQIFNHQFDGIRCEEIYKYATLKDWIRRKGKWADMKAQSSIIESERYIVGHAKGIIVESDWCAYNYLALNPSICIFYSKLPISPVFSTSEWNLENVDRYTIFTTAGGSPVKGHHILLKALSIVKDVFPQVKLFIPGDYGYIQKNSIKYNGYSKYLTSIVKNYDLSGNIKYLGKLTPEEMCKYMMRSHIYVMPSVIENHSSSLIEAMMIGMPTISSYVGGVSNYYRHNENGLLYRATEPEVLASNILRLFEDNTLAGSLAYEARVSTRQSRLSIDLKEDYIRIYNQCINH